MGMVSPQNKVETGREEAGGEREVGRSGHVAFHHSTLFFPLDDSCFPVFRQKQQVLPKPRTDLTEQQAVRLGVGRSTRETSGERAP